MGRQTDRYERRKESLFVYTIIDIFFRDHRRLFFPNASSLHRMMRIDTRLEESSLSAAVITP